MSERRRFWTLVLYLGAAQAAINIPVWAAAGQTFVSHIYLALISAASITVFAVIARTSHAGAEASSYVQFLLTEFLYTVGVAVIFIVISPAGGPVAGLAAGLAAAAALLAVTATYDLAARSYLLDFISRRIFRQRLSPGFGLPGSDFGEADIREAIPSAYPPPAARGDEPSPRSEPGHPDERRGPRSDELTEDVARGTAWAEGLLATASAADPTPGMPTPVMTSVGFVQSRDNRAKLAVIHYFRPRRLFKALRTMPKSVPFAGESFLVVARPWQPVPHRGPSPAAPKQDPRGSDGHCWVTFGEEGERYGVVSADHVLVPENAPIASKVRAETSRTETAGTVRERSAIMDAALIEMNDDPRPDLAPAPHSRVVGFKPIRLCASRGPVNGSVIELLGFIGGDFTKDPGGEPELRALMGLNVSGHKGDSGCLVLDREFEDGGVVAPYLMYLGVIQLADRQAGRGLFLDQVACQWRVNFQFNLPPASVLWAPVRGPTASRRRRVRGHDAKPAVTRQREGGS